MPIYMINSQSNRRVGAAFQDKQRTVRRLNMVASGFPDGFEDSPCHPLLPQSAQFMSAKQGL